MNHFDSNEWKKYINEQLEEEMKKQMEEHLATCDLCLELYVMLCEEQCNDSGLIRVQADFSDKVLGEIKSIKRKDTGRKKEIVNYVIAASLTLFITASGTFQTLYQKTKQAVSSVPNIGFTEKLFINGWSENLTNGTKNIINKINEKI
ncbi:MAG: hypothetical protein ACM3KR_08630 [Deltaproteobacteria bacterium]